MSSCGRRSLALLGAAVALASAAVWTETSRRDFVDGVVDAQMYVSHRAMLEPDTGCIEFYSRFDVDNNGFYDFACSDDSGPHLTLYLGSDSGYFPQSRLDYDVTSGGNVDLADLNLDGCAELIHSGWRDGRAVIYWGSASGPQPADTTVLAYSGQGEDVNVYDLDRDGYLDIIVGSSDGNLYFFWGMPGGYSSSNRTLVDLDYAIGHNTEIADFDKDGWGDIAVSMWTYNVCPVIYWGPGREPRDTVFLPFRWNNGHGITVGDFNRDEWLDIVYTGYDTVLTSLIYFGSDSGFRPASFLPLRPGKCYGGSAAADWNGDGWLDLVYLRGNWIDGGRWRPCVYMNHAGPPFFSDANRMDLGPDTLNASGGFIADFDFDGSIDIFVNNMERFDSSYVLWGPGHMVYTPLPVNNDHHGVFREPGGSYDRAKTSQYFSSVYDAGSDTLVLAGVSSWIAFEPPGARVVVAYRSGDSPVPDSTWTSFATVTGNGAQLPGQILGHRYLQYRVRFSYDRPCYLPDLEEITTILVLVRANSFDVGVEQVLAPRDSVDSGAVIVPSAILRNYGDQLCTFPVHMLIGGQYSDSFVVDMPPGGRLIVGFRPWVAGPLGNVGAVCYTAFSGDEDQSNDTGRSTVFVRQPPHRDVGVTQILAPLGTLDSGTVVAPEVTVRNFGNQVADFPVHFGIGTGYLDSAVVSGLGPGESATVSFAAWTALPGRHATTAFTSLSDDENRSNDTLTDSVVVRPSPRYDVGPVAILAPTDTLDSGAVSVPRAVMLNFGNQVADFPVHFGIGSGYLDSAVVTGLGPGESATVSFAAWTASVPGSFVVTCYTALGPDADRSNDTITGAVTVRPQPAPDVGPVVVLVPPDRIDSGMVVAPEVVVRNFGLVGAAFPVQLRIGAQYAESAVVTLAAGGEDTVSFAPWTAFPVGFQPIVCYTVLAGDGNPANDTIRDSVAVVPRPEYDVGPVAILAPPDTVDSGAAVVPQAVISNFGNQPAAFPVYFFIGTTYADSALLGLVPGQSDTVSFRVWIADPVGSAGVVCYTALVPDQDRTNDTLQGAVTVARIPEYDVGPTEIIAPKGDADSGTVIVPVAVVRNYGNTNASFPVYMTIGPSYSDSVLLRLGAGLSDTVTFAPWVAQPLGRFAVLCRTALAGDENPANDTVRGLVVVGPRPQIDVGARAVLAPRGRLDSGDLLTPLAVVHNYGTEPASFPVRMRIIAGYLDSTYVNGLAPGGDDTVSFAAWRATPLGRHHVVCWTALAGDQRPGNDTVLDSADVVPPQVHDVGAVAITAPFGRVSSGDTVRPRAIVHNFGTAYEMYFDVRFRIGSQYDRRVTVAAPLAPGAETEVTFPAWRAVLGDYALSCSTELVIDVQRANDRVVGAVHVGPAAVLAIEEDLFDRVETGTRQTYRFHAVLQSEQAEPVVLLPVAVAPAWNAWLVDSAGREGISDLGMVVPGVRTWFGLRVDAPPSNLSGSIESLPSVDFVVRGRLANDSTVADSAVLTLKLAPELAVHNYPNPFETRTRFVIGLPTPGKVSLTVYNRAGELVGRVIDREELSDQVYVREWDGTGPHGQRVARGTYDYVLEFAGVGRARRLYGKLVITGGK